MAAIWLQSARDAGFRHEFIAARSHGAAQGLSGLGLIPATGSGLMRPLTVPWHQLLLPCSEPGAGPARS